MEIDFKKAPFQFENIIEQLPLLLPGIKRTKKPEGITIHHSAVLRDTKYDAVHALKTYARLHIPLSGGIAYHICIPRTLDNKIYITRYIDYHTWHNGNFELNPRTRGILVDGDFTRQKPTETQLKKLRFVLDCMSSGSFKENGWSGYYDIPVHSTKTIQGSGKQARVLHGHSEVGATACPGSLLNFVKDYSNKNGKVSWGEWQPKKAAPKPKIPEWQKKQKKWGKERTFYLAESSSLYDLSTGGRIKPLKKGEKVSISSSTTVQGKEYYISTYSTQRNKPHGILKGVLISENKHKKNMKEIKELNEKVRKLSDQVVQDGKTLKEYKDEIDTLNEAVSSQKTKLDACREEKEKMREKIKKLSVEELDKPEKEEEKSLGFLDKIFKNFFELPAGLDKVATTGLFSVFSLAITDIFGVWEVVDFSSGDRIALVVAILAAFSATIEVLKKYARKIRN